MTDSRAATAPTIMRIQPTASMLMPLASSVTPQTRMAPTAMRMTPTVKPAGEIMRCVFPAVRNLTGAQRHEHDLARCPPVVPPERLRRRQLLQPPHDQPRLRHGRDQL